MALMDAGIPLREHVAGVSVGLVSEVDPLTGTIKDYRILTDILVSIFVDLFMSLLVMWQLSERFCWLLFLLLTLFIWKSLKVNRSFFQVM